MIYLFTWSYPVKQLAIAGSGFWALGNNISIDHTLRFCSPRAGPSLTHHWLQLIQEDGGGGVVPGQLKQHLQTFTQIPNYKPQSRKTRFVTYLNKMCRVRPAVCVEEQPTLTSFSETPLHLLTMLEAEMLKKVVLHSVATAFASSVFPVPVS